MNDEEYEFTSDVINKKITARSAFNRKTRGGRVRLPSDNLSKRELQKMNGECKSYRLNDPMTIADFQSIPDDLKVTYIKLIRSKYGVPDSHLAKAMGCKQQYFSRYMKKLGLSNGKTNGEKKWDKEGFYAWWNGVKQMPTDQEEPVVEDHAPEEVFMEEDVSFEEVPAEPEVSINGDQTFKLIPLPSPFAAVPSSGTMSFSGPVAKSLATIAQILGEEDFILNVGWYKKGEKTNG